MEHTSTDFRPLLSLVRKELPIASGMIYRKPVFLLGSSPSANLSKLRPDAVTICINSSFAPFSQLTPDILFVNAWTLNGSDFVRQQSVLAMRNRKCRHLVCVTTRLAYPQMLSELKDSGLSFESSEELTKQVRAEIVSHALGRPTASYAGNDVASTGVTALIFAYGAGFSELATSGFSTKGGHSYLEGETPRGHTTIDAEIFASLGTSLDS